MRENLGNTGTGKNFQNSKTRISLKNTVQRKKLQETICVHMCIIRDTNLCNKNTKIWTGRTQRIVINFLCEREVNMVGEEEFSWKHILLYKKIYSNVSNNLGILLKCRIWFIRTEVIGEVPRFCSSNKLPGRKYWRKYG